MRKFHLYCVVAALIAAAFSAFTGNLPGSACFIGLAILSNQNASEEE